MLLVRFPSNFSSISISFFIFSAPNGAVDPDPERLFTDPDPAVIFFSQKKISGSGESFGSMWIRGISYNNSVKIKKF